MVRFNVFACFLGQPKKVKQHPTPKTEEEEEVPAEKERDVKEEIKPPSHSGDEKDQPLSKDSVTALENVMTLFSAKVNKINSC